MAGATVSKGRRTPKTSRSKTRESVCGPGLDGAALSWPRLHGRARLVRADGRGVPRQRVHAGEPAFDGGAVVPWHRLRDPAGGAVLPARWRADGFVGRRAPDDSSVTDAG